MNRKYVAAVAGAFVLGSGTTAGLLSTAIAKTSNETMEQLEIFGAVLDTIERKYVRPVPVGEAITAALKGMLQSLDPGSDFITPQEYAALRAYTGGKASAGLTLKALGGPVRIVSVIDGGPAAKAGVLPGDYLLAIDRQVVTGLPFSRVTGMLRGEPGQRVVLSLARNGAETLDLSMALDAVARSMVEGRLIGDVGYMRISDLSDGVGSRAKDELAQLRARGPALRGVVLDLRDNPGGPLDQTIEVADLFLIKA